ncbi:MAG: deoxyribose-phosphate aldolase [Chloroflexi bacterium]|nr:deoxyribose-phosphate aldolase [Chloroflexota bacterium]
MDITRDELKRMLDVALLQAISTPAQIEALAHVVRDEGFGQICVNALHTRRAATILTGSPAKVVACVSFPLGTTKTQLKVCETEEAVADGAGEIDMVLNLGAFLGGDRRYAEEDVAAVVRTAAGRPVKVIIETPFLNDAQKADAARLVQNAGAAFVKTCSGFSPDPVALFEDVRLIRQTIGPAMGIKASGRVGNYFRFMALREAGATRVGLVLEQAREILRGWDAAH